MPNAAASHNHNHTNPPVWGFLMPISHPSSLLRLDFWETKDRYQIGRDRDCDHIFTTENISRLQCIVWWNGKRGEDYKVTLWDFSKIGTFINGCRIETLSVGYLVEGCTVTFGSVDAEGYYFRNGLDDGPECDDRVDEKYALIHPVGQGSYGKVYKAMDRYTGRIYACKVVAMQSYRQRLYGTEMAIGDIMKEVHVLGRLSHPNICQIKEWYYEQQKGQLSMILEWISGGDLFDYLVLCGALSEFRTRKLTYQICNALKYIHSLGIAHRDLKPENILMTEDIPPKIKLTDFGFAKQSGSQSMFSSFCGTPQYMAPEIRNDEKYGQLVDSWSLGITIFQMLAGTRPRLVTVGNRPYMVDWMPMLSRNRGISPEAYDFVDLLLKYYPDDRLPMANALQHVWIRDMGDIEQM